MYTSWSGYRTPRCEHESLLALPRGARILTRHLPAFLTQTALGRVRAARAMKEKSAGGDRTAHLPTYWSNLHIAHYWMDGVYNYGINSKYIVCVTRNK